MKSENCDHDWIPLEIKIATINSFIRGLGQQLEFKACTKCGRVALTDFGMDTLKNYH